MLAYDKCMLLFSGAVVCWHLDTDHRSFASKLEQGFKQFSAQVSLASYPRRGYYTCHVYVVKCGWLGGGMLAYLPQVYAAVRKHGNEWHRPHCGII